MEQFIEGPYLIYIYVTILPLSYGIVLWGIEYLLGRDDEIPKLNKFGKTLTIFLCATNIVTLIGIPVVFLFLGVLYFVSKIMTEN